MAPDFDASSYVRAPVLDVPSAVGLAVRLLTELPKGASETVRKSARRLRKTTIALQRAWGQSDRAGTQEDRRPADTAIDNAWASLKGRLDAYASLPAKRYPKAARAAELVEILFPKGLTFLTLPYPAEWAESEQRLRDIEKDRLGKDIDALAGREFLAEVKRTHAEYGKALGITKRSTGTESVSLLDPLRAVSSAIADYALAVAATKGDKPSSLDVVKKALRPIDEYREAASRRAQSGGTEEPEPSAPVTASTPVPEVPK